jgi:hypothetical protein
MDALNCRKVRTYGGDDVQTLEEIQAQITALGKIDSFGTKKEIKYLPEILSDSERILGLTSGFLDGNTWLIVCTNKRLVFVDKGLIYGLKQLEMPLEKISSIEQKMGLMMGSITVSAGSSKMQIDNVLKEFVKPFVAVVNQARDALKAAQTPVLQASQPIDVVSQLERLAALKTQGILTEEEFQGQKRKMLGL